MKVSKGQVAVITGGASGIGFALARELAQRGLRIMLADVEIGALKSAEHQLVQDGFEVGSELTDVTDYNWTFGVNLFGVVHGLQAMVPRWRLERGTLLTLPHLPDSSRFNLIRLTPRPSMQ
ncbi:SDR family NAD(P)-dependent oxidoreductase [Bradyrhizobium sp. CCGUVB1N3]|uniref:SDR family NAD(P)-dependent oxidoreductase n=1 Tax=Bradyrhizobium sp. CCGUVB1N3 TaxID=2949629 RepID=UPI0020B27764|nr:SDR family NAD(P)-dependent oxidoreductase [Bradyrhizobium sp. CCGUVB1N3]MCP3475455.1 SDR family NAD(P)-dependent oxidoreductase [Bradyrhizobium sp. CCGUVB1N3]